MKKTSRSLAPKPCCWLHMFHSACRLLPYKIPPSITKSAASLSNDKKEHGNFFLLPREGVAKFKSWTEAERPSPYRKKHIVKVHVSIRMFSVQPDDEREVSQITMRTCLKHRVLSTWAQNWFVPSYRLAQRERAIASSRLKTTQSAFMEPGGRKVPT